jgi:hypothetical protein
VDQRQIQAQWVQLEHLIVVEQVAVLVAVIQLETVLQVLQMVVPVEMVQLILAAVRGTQMDQVVVKQQMAQEDY